MPWACDIAKRWTGAFEASDLRFPDWIRQLSDRLGEVQYFVTDRVSEHHGWARAIDGELMRAYYFGDANVPLHLGDPTDIECELGVGHRWLDEGWQTWGDAEWDAFFETTPCELHVMDIARIPYRRDPPDLMRARERPGDSRDELRRHASMAVGRDRPTTQSPRASVGTEAWLSHETRTTSSGETRHGASDK